MGRADYTDTRSIIRALEKYTPDYDLSQGENAASLSYALAESALRKDARFRAAANNQDIYLFFQDTLRRLKEDPAFKEELALRLSETAARILTRSRMVFLAAAREEQLPSIQSAAGRILGLLPFPAAPIPAMAAAPSRKESFCLLLLYAPPCLWTPPPRKSA